MASQIRRWLVFPIVALMVLALFLAPTTVPNHSWQKTAVDENWAGYAVSGKDMTSVQAEWVQPKAECSGLGQTATAFWVGLDGFHTKTVEQIGTSVQCSYGAASYSAWYEMYPDVSMNLPEIVNPGDTMHAIIVYEGADSYRLTIEDKTAGWTWATTQYGQYARSSAEIIAEAPTSGTTYQILPLTRFEDVSFWDSMVNGEPLSDVNRYRIVIGRGQDRTTTSALSGDGFTVTWKRS